MPKILQAPSILRVASLVALAVSSALLLDYVAPSPSFCEVGSGCDAVRRSGFGAIAGVPVPVFGVLGFAALIATSLSRARLARAWAVGAAAAAGLLGLTLLVVQAVVVGAFCKLCVAVDVCAMITSCAAVAWWRRGLALRIALPPLCWVALGAAAVFGPLAWAKAKPPPGVPAGVAALSEPGFVSIVEFSDFECPFCRIAHPELKAAIANSKRNIRFTRKVMPLAIHPHARDAARAYVCAAVQGKGDAMADALFAATDLSPEGCDAAARAAGVRFDAYRACLGDASTDAAIERDITFVRSARFQGLPTVWVGDEALLGVRVETDYAEAIERAATGNALGERWRRGLAALALVALVTGALFSIGWRRRLREVPSESPLTDQRNRDV